MFLRLFVLHVYLKIKSENNMENIKKGCIKCGNTKTYLDNYGECGGSYKSWRKCEVKQREN
jgi:hypothetical protein